MDKFLDLKGNSQGQKKEYLQKLAAEKDKLKRNKEHGQTASILQKYLRGCHARITYRKTLETDLNKNLTGMDKLAQVLLAQKKQTLRLPLDKVIFLINTLRMIKRLRKGHLKRAPPGLKKTTLAQSHAPAWKFPFAEETINLAKWVDRGLISP